MNKPNVEKWKGGSIVDDWMKSKAYQRFQAYHPYLSYSETHNERFIRPDGKPGADLNPDSEALFILGEKAFRLLGTPIGTVEDFDVGMKAYFQFIEELRERVSEAYSTGRFNVRNLDGQIYQPDFQEADNGWILDFAWNGLTKRLAGSDLKEVSGLYKEAFIFHVFYEIDNALIGMVLDGRGAVVASIGAADALANAMAIESGSEKLQEARREMSYRGAMEKLARDPKQKEKAFILECWQGWQKSPEAYGSKAAFARDMIAKCEHLKSQKKIEDWCREWEKANPAG